MKLKLPRGVWTQKSVPGAVTIDGYSCMCE
jgi:hypothetical protein